MGERFSGWLVVEPWLFAAVQPQVTTASVHPRLRSFLWNAPSFLLVHIGDPSSNQATTLESQMIHMIQELFGQTLRAVKASSDRVEPDSKQDKIVALLRRPEGANLDVLVKETGWQKHSVRGFLAGTVRKKLKLPLLSEKIDGVRNYRIGTAKAAKTKKTSAARKA